jgi:hypothetical protein
MVSPRCRRSFVSCNVLQILYWPVTHPDSPRRKLHPYALGALVSLAGVISPQENVANLQQLDNDYALMERVLMEKILIVEDDQAVHKALKHLIESAGYAVEICRDGKSALEALSHDRSSSRYPQPAIICLVSERRLPADQAAAIFTANHYS